MLGKRDSKTEPVMTAEKQSAAKTGAQSTGGAEVFVREENRKTEQILPIKRQSAKTAGAHEWCEQSGSRIARGIVERPNERIDE